MERVIFLNGMTLDSDDICFQVCWSSSDRDGGRRAEKIDSSRDFPPVFPSSRSFITVANRSSAANSKSSGPESGSRIERNVIESFEVSWLFLSLSRSGRPRRTPRWWRRRPSSCRVGWRCRPRGSRCSRADTEIRIFFKVCVSRSFEMKSEKAGWENMVRVLFQPRRFLSGGLLTQGALYWMRSHPE